MLRLSVARSLRWGLSLVVALGLAAGGAPASAALAAWLGPDCCCGEEAPTAPPESNRLERSGCPCEPEVCADLPQSLAPLEASAPGSPLAAQGPAAGSYLLAARATDFPPVSLRPRREPSPPHSLVSLRTVVIVC